MSEPDIRFREFYKIEGGGNDFITLIDMDNAISDDSLPELAKRVCPRATAVGADGIIIARRSTRADLKMIYYNSDGSHASLCGNGLRALGLLAHRLKLVKKSTEIETDAGVFKLEVTGPGRVKNSFPEPKIIETEKSLKCGGVKCKGLWVDVGIPYFCVILSSTEDLDALDIMKLGKFLRFHEEFGTQGTNVTFVAGESGDSIRIRIYERGVEAETLSSGTGSHSSAVAAALHFGMNPPITVISPGGEVIIDFHREGDSFKNVSLEGNAGVIYSGKFEDI